MDEVEYAGHWTVKVAIERHPVMVPDNQMDCCLPRHNGTGNIGQTHRRHWGMDAPPPDQCRQSTPELTSPLRRTPSTPPAPPGDNDGSQCFQFKDVPPGYVYICTPLSNIQFCNLDAYAKNSNCNKDYIPALLTDEGTSTGWYTICCVLMHQTSHLQTKVAFWAIQQGKTNVDRKEQDAWVHYYQQFTETLEYIIKHILIRIIKVQWSGKGKSAWRW